MAFETRARLTLKLIAGHDFIVQTLELVGRLSAEQTAPISIGDLHYRLRLAK